MAATVLNSPRAVAMTVYVIRAFVKMREDLAANAAILKRLAEIDKTLLLHIFPSLSASPLITDYRSLVPDYWSPVTVLRPPVSAFQLFSVSALPLSSHSPVVRRAWSVVSGPVVS
jgi:hypothetical protein